MKTQTKQSRNKLQPALFICGVVLLMLGAGSASAAVNGAFYMYDLSDFTGTIPYNWAALSVDKERNEIYVIYKNDVEVFNDKGMKIYSFGNDESIKGVIYDVAVDREGMIYLLLAEGDNYSIARCNYRGEMISEIKFRNFPKEFLKIFPNRMVYRNGNLYLVDLIASKKVAVIGTDGVFKDGYDINSLISLQDFDGKPGQEKEISGFTVDKDGNMLFTVPTIFRAFKVSPDRKVESFGEAGNIPGKFSVIAGIDTDEKGNCYIADTLKSVVMVYDRNFNFIVEFGYRGEQPGNMIAPRNMVVNNGRVYVSQARKRGVSVYKIIQD